MKGGLVTLIFGAAAAFVACAVGGLVGFASSLLLLPVLLLLEVPLWDAVVLNLVLAIVTRLPSVIALRAHVNLQRTGAMLVGSVPGIALGLVLASSVPSASLEVAAAVLVLASGVYLRWAPAPAAEPASSSGTAAVLAGACSGVLGVTTSLNGVPPAVLLARSGSGMRNRLADLSLFFALGNCLILAAIAFADGLSMDIAPTTVAVWATAGMTGNAVGVHLAARFDERLMVSLTIWLVILSGAASLVSNAPGLLP